MSIEEELIEELGSFAYDPYGFVMWAFPWGEPGTDLAKETGPDEWQKWVLLAVRDGLIDINTAILIAVASGHGIGKSALVAWLLWWAFSTFPDTRGVVTANTENQLKTKTWVEIAKWYRLFIAKDLFKCTATALFATDEARAREWRIDIVPWSERNTEAFAGLHNAGKRIIIVFDEASAIPDVIHEVTEGALTDENTEIMWFMFGNPTLTTGRFREAFDGGKFAHRWKTRNIDSRTVKRTNKKQLNQWAKDYGEDSDFFRVRVRGEFPHTDASSFISRDLVVAATERELGPTNEPWVLGVDVARFGDDFSVIYPRRGRDARSMPPKILQGVNTTTLVAHVIGFIEALNPAAVFVDGGGVGGGVVDQLAQLGYPVYEVQFGAGPDGTNMKDPQVLYGNKRAEIWGGMRSFLETGCIPETVSGIPRTMIDELTAPTYNLNSKEKIMLEPKAMIKSRLGFSPDVADALAVTFAYPYLDRPPEAPQKTSTHEYNPFAEERIYAQSA